MSLDRKGPPFAGLPMRPRSRRQPDRNLLCPDARRYAVRVARRAPCGGGAAAHSLRDSDTRDRGELDGHPKPWGIEAADAAIEAQRKHPSNPTCSSGLLGAATSASCPAATSLVRPAAATTAPAMRFAATTTHMRGAPLLSCGPVHVTVAAHSAAPRTASMPPVPASPAAPAQASPEGITAPIEPGPLPAITIPAVASAAEDKLCVLHL